MKRRRFSPILIAGLLALLSALGLIALVATGSIPHDINPTDYYETLNAVARARLTQTAEIREAETQTVIPNTASSP